MATPLLNTQSDTRKRKSMEGSSKGKSTKVLSIEVRFDKTLGQKILNARMKLSNISRRALDMEAQPTMTLFAIQAGLPDYTMKKIQDALHGLSSSLPMDIVLSVLGTSPWKGGEGDHSSFSILATPSIPLLNFHKTLHSVMVLLDGLIVMADKEDQPNSWIPKCFLGLEMPESRMQEAYNILWHEFELPVHGQLSEIGMAEVDMESGVKTPIIFFDRSLLASLKGMKPNYDHFRF